MPTSVDVLHVGTGQTRSDLGTVQVHWTLWTSSRAISKYRLTASAAGGLGIVQHRIVELVQESFHITIIRAIQCVVEEPWLTHFSFLEGDTWNTGFQSCLGNVIAFVAQEVCGSILPQFLCPI